jgi:hypothetical protein
MVNIANPVYDVVFKYLMDDNKVAIKLLSLIIGKKIISLEMKPTEMRGSLTDRCLSVLHIDFSALVDFGPDEGQKQVLIELQKAKMPSDIMRFRRYLGTQYADFNNFVTVKDKYDKERKQALPILSIYFLGYPLKKIKEPVIKVERRYISGVTGKKIDEKEEFVESLTHDSIIIQIPYLKHSRKTKLEQVLSVFEPSNEKYLAVNEDDYPEEYRDVIHRLLTAAAEPEIRTNMELEKVYLEELLDYERTLDQKVQLLEEKEQVIEEKEEALKKAVSVLAEKLHVSHEEAEKLIKNS